MTCLRSASADVASCAPTIRSVPSDSLRSLWVTNWRIGWPERRQGLHYWLVWEYSALLRTLDVSPGATVVDIGSGAHSIWPIALAQRRGVRVIATDLHPRIDDQRRRLRRASRAGVVADHALEVVRCDARHLPFDTESVDAVTAVSTLEHITGTSAVIHLQLKRDHPVGAQCFRHRVGVRRVRSI